MKSGQTGAAGERSEAPPDGPGAVTGTGVRSGEQAFRPRARLIRTLGRELITNEFIAVQELVKNSYDADASVVTLTFEEPLQPGTGALTVSDNGSGMSLDDLQHGWMEPATLSKVRAKRSASGTRRVTGEKGIGRFAAARIASILELESVSARTGRRVTAHFDWGVFDDPARYLDEIQCVWREEPAPGAPSGTTLRLVGLHDDWTRGEEANVGEAFRRLRAELSRLVSPLSTSDFKILLEVPEQFKEFGGAITRPAFLGRPQYWLTGSVTEDGFIDAAFQHLDEDPVTILEKGQRPRIALAERRALACGPFSFEFRVWDRRREDLETLAESLGSTLRDLQRDLNATSGIAIYRDGFRVLLPQNADWLNLDLRRVQNPTLRVSNNQVVGLVAISRDENPGLIDQSNRQGIVDSPAFEDFRTAVREVIAKLEVRRELARHPTPEAPRSAAGLFGKLDLGPLRQIVQSRYATDSDLQRALDETDRALTEGVGEVKVVLARYRRLATLGQLIDGVLHDGRTPVNAISNALTLARRDLERATRAGDDAVAIRERLIPRFDTMERQAEQLSDLFRRISPFSGRKRGRPQRTTMERILADTVALAHERVEEVGATVELPTGETTVTVDESEMQGIFFNLVDNALYWLERVPRERRRLRLEVRRHPGELHVLVSDSGPGVEEELQSKIFDPYFSTRPEGVGLGLALAGELALEYDGALDLIADGPLDGATFRVVLRRRLGETE